MVRRGITYRRSPPRSYQCAFAWGEQEWNHRIESGKCGQPSRTCGACVGWDDTGMTQPVVGEPELVHSGFVSYATHAPHAIALCVLRPGGAGASEAAETQHVSYGALLIAARSLATRLRHQCHLRAGCVGALPLGGALLGVWWWWRAAATPCDTTHERSHLRSTQAWRLLLCAGGKRRTTKQTLGAAGHRATGRCWRSSVRGVCAVGCGARGLTCHYAHHQPRPQGCSTRSLTCVWELSVHPGSDVRCCWRRASRWWWRSWQWCWPAAASCLWIPHSRPRV